MYLISASPRLCTFDNRDCYSPLNPQILSWCLGCMWLAVNICSLAYTSTVIPPSLGNLPPGAGRDLALGCLWWLIIKPMASKAAACCQACRGTRWGTSVWPIMRAVSDRWQCTSHGSPSRKSISNHGNHHGPRSRPLHQTGRQGAGRSPDTGR